MITTQRVKFTDYDWKRSGYDGNPLDDYQFSSDTEVVIKTFSSDPIDIRKDYAPKSQIFTGYITTTSVDRDGEIMDPSGADLTQYAKNETVLWGHDYKERLPVGRSRWLKTDTFGIRCGMTFNQNDDFSKKIEASILDGSISLGYSVGFIPLEWVDNPVKGCTRKFTKWILLEYSVVPVPANQDCVVEMVTKGFISEDEAEIYTLVEEKIMSKEIDEKDVNTKVAIEERIKRLESKCSNLEEMHKSLSGDHDNLNDAHNKTIDRVDKAHVKCDNLKKDVEALKKGKDKAPVEPDADENKKSFDADKFVKIYKESVAKSLDIKSVVKGEIDKSRGKVY
jgi:HK97 family phage prohead protease